MYDAYILSYDSNTKSYLDPRRKGAMPFSPHIGYLTRSLERYPDAVNNPRFTQYAMSEADCLKLVAETYRKRRPFICTGSAYIVVRNLDPQNPMGLGAKYPIEGHGR